MDEFRNTLKKAGHNFLQGLKRFKKATLVRFTRWIDPKLEKYRSRSSQHQPLNSKPTTVPATATKSTVPETIEEFLDLIKRTPRSVLSQRERHVIATIMNFPTVKVSELMLPPSTITYVKEDEVLGPLTLDHLYRSGFQHFPVIDQNRQIIGLIHTTALNNLEIKQTIRAKDIMEKKIYYLRDDYTLNQALAAFLRTNCYFFLVVDRFERIVGMLTYQMLIDFLLGETPKDNFDRDDDRLAVAKRK